MTKRNQILIIPILLLLVNLICSCEKLKINEKDVFDPEYISISKIKNDYKRIPSDIPTYIINKKKYKEGYVLTYDEDRIVEKFWSFEKKEEGYEGVFEFLKQEKFKILCKKNDYQFFIYKKEFDNVYMLLCYEKEYMIFPSFKESLFSDEDLNIFTFRPFD